MTIPSCAKAFAALLEARMPEALIVAEAATGRETLRECARHQPDLLVLDISMPDLGGLDVLAGTAHGESAHQGGDRLAVHRSRLRDPRAQARRQGYLPKGVMARELVAALRSVLEGRTWLDPSVADLVVDAALHPETAPEDQELSSLSPREREVLTLIAEGRTGPEIAKILGISAHTANRHRANLMEKLQIHNKTDLVKAGAAAECGAGLRPLRTSGHRRSRRALCPREPGGVDARVAASDRNSPAAIALCARRSARPLRSHHQPVPRRAAPRRRGRPAGAAVRARASGQGGDQRGGRAADPPARATRRWNSACRATSMSTAQDAKPAILQHYVVLAQAPDWDFGRPAAKTRAVEGAGAGHQDRDVRRDVQLEGAGF